MIRIALTLCASLIAGGLAAGSGLPAAAQTAPEQAAAQQMAPKSISTPEDWANRVLAALRAADYGEFELLLRGAIEDRADEIQAMLGQLSAWVGDRHVIYVDLLLKRQLGTSMEQRVYSVYYGDRRFMYVSMVFARGEGNWLVMAFNFDTEVGNLLERLD